ncbi:MAG: glycosyltransferase family 39 protein [Chloroflexi bacterium]|nr:glycosyltransferase family 39 protein [Chloroflexota bacterium]
MKQFIRRPLFLLALILVIGAVPRLVNLERVPVGSDGDVAWYGINALDWVDRSVWPYYIRELYGTEPLSVYGIGAMIPFVGISQTTARLASALWNVVGIGLLYAAAYWLLADADNRIRVRAGLLAALAGALSLHAIHISRLGLPAPFIPTVVALLVACTAWARAKGGWWRWALAGAALALTQYIYIAARVLPLAVIVWFLHDALLNREGFKTRWRGWVLMAVVALVLVSPNLYTYLTMPRAFFGRAEAATPFSGAFIWTFDTSQYGGPLGLAWVKLVRNFRAVGIAWQSAPYTSGLEQPILSPVFFVGFLLALWLLVRQPRRIAGAWLWLPLPLVLLPDILTSATTQPHAMRQIDMLTFVFLLAGIGLAYGWEWLATLTPSPSPSGRGGAKSRGYIAAFLVGMAAVAIGVSAAWEAWRYLVVYPPEQYANPETSWRNDQASLDISRRITAQPDKAYLIPYTEWERSTMSWMTAGAYRQRGSAITVDGTLQVDNPPERITILQAADPRRVRWDGTTAQVDDRLWVLLDKGRTLLLPPLSSEQVSALGEAQAAAIGETLVDLSGQQIATFYDVPTPDGLFTARPVVDNAADASFGGELQLNGYSVANADLVAGQPFFVTLYWTTIQPPSEDYEIFVQLWNDAGEAVAQWQNVPFGAMYRTRIWQGSEMLATHHWLELPEDAPIGRYRLVAGVYRTLKGERLKVGDGSSADPANNVAILGNLRLPLAGLVEPVEPPPQAITLGDTLEVAGLEIEPSPLTPLPQGEGKQMNLTAGDTITLKLLWGALKPPPVDYTLFLHLTPVGGTQPSAQVDRLIRPDYPTGVWRTGDRINDAVDFVLPADLAAGQYELWLGVYYWQTGERLAIQTRGDGDVTADQRLRLAVVTVE